MALIKCSECGKEISDKASSCPNCGFLLKPSTENETGQKQEEILENEVLNQEPKEKNMDGKPKKSKKKRILQLSVILVLAILIGIGVYVFQTKFNKENIIIGEWNLSGINNGQSVISIKQLEAVGLSLEGSASFTKDKFVFSLDYVKTTGTWEEVDDDKEDKYYKLVTDDGSTTHAMIDDKETLYIFLPGEDDDSMVIFEK